MRVPLSYDAFCLPDGLFFDRPAAEEPGEGFALSPPAGWTARDHDSWRMLWPDDAELPEQGWKLHVSATPDTAAGTLAAAGEYCLARRLPFKHLPSRAALWRRNGKYAPRGASGKFITVYPRDDAEFTEAATDLDRLLRGRPGPYILSDTRIGDGPVYARYGGFLALEVRSGGERVPAIRQPDGTLVPDVRHPVFRPPAWVTLPAVLAAPARRLELPYRITGALHFSNGGGVYRAERDGRTVVLKEARPHAGLDAAGHDAVRRLRHEHRVLGDLAGLDGIPDVYQLFEAWEHTYLAMEHLPGVRLGRWIASHCGLYGDDDGPYRERAGRLADRLDALLAAVHARGWVCGDLHPGNILVDADDRPHLVDFECALPVGTPTPAALGAAGFRAPTGTRGADIDRYALAAIRLSTLVPLTPLLELAPEKLTTHRGYAPEAEPAVQRLRRARPARRQEPCWPGDDPIGALVRAIRASATPDRPDRLFPGDIETFRTGGAGFGHGAAGVLYALDHAGHRIDPVWRTWLCEHPPPEAGGFWTGAHGVAYALDRLGHHEHADALLDRAPLPHGAGLASGLAGAGLTMLDIAGRRRTDELTETAIAIAVQLTKVFDDASTDLPAGLLTGWSGPALLCLGLAGRTGDRGWLTEADRMLARDLSRCPIGEDGARQYVDGRRLLPYVGTGSGGVALVAATLAPHLPDAAAVRALPTLRRACRPRLTVYPGLMQGRAGLMLAAPDEPLQPLDLHAVRYADGIAFPGTTLRRLSMDVATGTAGVLLAVLQRLAHRPTLPFFDLPHTPGRPAGPMKGTPAWTTSSNCRTSPPRTRQPTPTSTSPTAG